MPRPSWQVAPADTATTPRSSVSAPPPTPRPRWAPNLWGLHDEASERGYRFDAGRIDVPRQRCTDVDLPVTTGQMAAERTHLEVKLARRAPELLPLPERLDPHPVFHVVPGPVEDWERAAP